MYQTLAALTVFIGLHSIPAMPGLRTRIITATGRSLYLALYSVVSTAALVWLLWEALSMDYVELWSPALWHVAAAMVMSPIGVFLVISGLISANPFSVTLRRNIEPSGRIVKITRHPVLWGFVFWSASHLIANGDFRSLLLFGAFTAFSAAGIAIAESRARKAMGDHWAARCEGSSVFPLGAAVKERSFPGIDSPMVIGALLTAVITTAVLCGGHETLIGVDPLATASALF